MTCLSRPALLSADVELKLWFTVLLNVIHCLFRSVAHPMQMHICIQKNTLLILIVIFTHVEPSGNPAIGKGKIRDTQTTDDTSQHIHIKGFIFMIEC